MPNLDSVVKFFPVPSETYSSTLSASISAGAATVPVNSASDYDDGDVIALTVDAGTVKQATFTGTKSGNQFVNCVWTEGNVGATHDLGAPIIDYDSATHLGMIAKGVKVQHNDDGTHGAVTATSLSVSGTTTLSGNVTVGGTLDIPDGSIKPQDLQSGTGGTWDWQTWAPTFTNFTIGNGTVDGAYVQIGKTVIARLKVIFGTTSSLTSQLLFTAPVAINVAYTTDDIELGTGSILDVGASNYSAYVFYEGGSGSLQLVTLVANGTYGQKTGVSPIVPFTWGNGDRFNVTLVYQTT